MLFIVECYHRSLNGAKMGIVLAAYGSFDLQARGTYEKIKSAYEQAFPGTFVLLAFTSDTIRRRLSEEQGIFFHNPSTALAELKDLTCRNVVIQSLQVVPGSEFHKAAILVNKLMNDREKSGFRNIVIGMPLLACLEDCMKVSKILRPVIQTTKLEGPDRETSANIDGPWNQPSRGQRLLANGKNPGEGSRKCLSGHS